MEHRWRRSKRSCGTTCGFTPTRSIRNAASALDGSTCRVAATSRGSRWVPLRTTDAKLMLFELAFRWGEVVIILELLRSLSLLHLVPTVLGTVAVVDRKVVRLLLEGGLHC